MIPLAAGQMILVCVDDPAAARVMRGVVHALGGSHSFFFLLAHEGLLDVLGPGPHRHGCDVQACVLNPDRFALVITFGSLRCSGAGSPGAWLVSYFDEIGVPTLELQKTLFQEGCYPMSDWPEHSGARQSPDGRTVFWRYAARHLAAWGGPAGIGYPRPPVDPYDLALREDLIGVTSSLDHAEHSEKDRYKFTIAVLKVAMAHPELSFCWVVRSEELGSELAAPLLKLIADAALPNLWLESAESAHGVIKRARFGIALPSTALLDHQHENKPVLLYATALSSAARAVSLGGSFSNYFELELLLPQVAARPDHYAVELMVPDFQPSKLDAVLQMAMSHTKRSPDWLQVAPRYLAQLEALVPPVQSTAMSDQAAVAALEKLSVTLTGIVERLGVIQRSTVGYKALKLVKFLRGGRR